MALPSPVLTSILVLVLGTEIYIDFRVRRFQVVSFIPSRCSSYSSVKITDVGDL